MRAVARGISTAKDPHEAAGQNVEQKPTEKLLARG